MFAISQVKQIARLLTTLLHFDHPAFAGPEIEIVDISQTVRINENNVFIVKSTLGIDALTLKLQESSVLQQLRNTPTLVDTIIKQLITQLGVDSYIHTSQNPPTIALDAILPRASQDSKKPLMVLSAAPIDYEKLDPRWSTMDLPALWIGQDFVPTMKEVEAFFAITPALKIETALNRYQPFEHFADCAIGLVRL
jgi:hypothetical protein